MPPSLRQSARPAPRALFIPTASTGVSPADVVHASAATSSRISPFAAVPPLESTTSIRPDDDGGIRKKLSPLPPLPPALNPDQGDLVRQADKTRMPTGDLRSASAKASKEPASDRDVPCVPDHAGAKRPAPPPSSQRPVSQAVQSCVGRVRFPPWCRPAMSWLTRALCLLMILLVVVYDMKFELSKEFTATKARVFNETQAYALVTPRLQPAGGVVGTAMQERADAAAAVPVSWGDTSIKEVVLDGLGTRRHTCAYTHSHVTCNIRWYNANAHAHTQ